MESNKDKCSAAELEQQLCPARTEYGCSACGLFKSPTCFGRHLEAADERLHCGMAELERMQAQLQKERTRMYNLRKRAREAENKVQRQAAAVMRQKELVQTTEKQRKNILRPDGFKEKVRRTTIQRQKYLRGLERKNTRAGSPSEKKSLCNICSVCTCSWMLCGEPVEGWVAEPSKLYKDGWVVLRCPEAKL